MAENKTKATKNSVEAFLAKVKDKRKKEDCLAIVAMMRSVTKLEPVMWGSAIVGFGTYHYVYESGREGDMILIGFSPRAQNIALYLMGGLSVVEKELPKLGKHSTGKGCLYINTLADIDAAVLKKIFTLAYKNAVKMKGKSGQ